MTELGETTKVVVRDGLYYHVSCLRDEEGEDSAAACEAVAPVDVPELEECAICGEDLDQPNEEPVEHPVE